MAATNQNKKQSAKRNRAPTIGLFFEYNLQTDCLVTSVIVKADNVEAWVIG